MAAPAKIIIYAPNPHHAVSKSAIAGKYGGVEVVYVDVFEFGKTNKTEEFLFKNPNGQVPTADTPDGPVWESTAIAYYVARIGHDAVGLLGATPYQQAVVDEWIHFARSRLENLFDLVGFAVGRGTYDKGKFDAALSNVTGAFAVLERHFTNKGTHFLTGDRVTLADIVVVSHIAYPLKFSIDKEVLNHYPKTLAYITSILAQPNFQAVLGDIKIADKFTPPK